MRVLLVAAVAMLSSIAGAQVRTVAVDERLGDGGRVRLGDTLLIAAAPGAPRDTAVVAAFVRRGADPSEIARPELRIRMHLDQLQHVIGYGDRVDRFAVQTTSDSATGRAIDRINAVAFGFRAHRSHDIAVETSQTFAVVSRFHRAIGFITIVASAIFLLCIMLLRVEERRRDIAALRLLGISRRTVLATVVLESALIALIGSAAGIAIGSLGAWIVNAHYQAAYRTPLVFALVTPTLALQAATLSVVLGVAAGWLAGMRLVRAEPLRLLGR